MKDMENLTCKGGHPTYGFSQKELQANKHKGGCKQNAQVMC
jgi:hypothetical protein